MHPLRAIGFMKLEQQVTSLEISKRLKELGVKQESLFDWYDVGNDVYFLGTNADAASNARDYSNSTAIGYEQRIVSAFTCAELGEMLPNEYTYCRKTGGEWYISFDSVHYGNQEHDVSEANARGKMLIYLIENGLCPKT